MTANTDEFLGELRLGRQLTTTGQVAAGGLALMAALLFLLAGPIMPLVGPRAALASMLAAIVLGLTLLNVLELLAGSGRRGGTYVLIQETLGGPGAFLAGWSILAGSVALGAALARATASHLLFLDPTVQVPVAYVALVLFGVLILVQLFQVLPRRPLLWPLMVILLMALAVVVLSTVPRLDPQLYRSAPPLDLGDLVRSVAWLTAGYIALEALLASRRQIREPGQHLPPALLATLLIGSLAFAVTVLVTAGLSPSTSLVETGLVSVLATASFLPDWMVGILALLALVLATNGCLMAAARQMYALSRDGALPGDLRRVRGPFLMPPLLFGTLAVATVPLIIWGPIWWLIDLAASLFLVTMTLLNAAYIHSHRTEPERQRPFVIPFYPLVPAVAIALNVALLSALRPLGLLGGGLWLLLGMVAYLTYARRRQVAAQEGVVVFGWGRRPEKREGACRILVPLGPGQERHLVLRLAAALAHQLDGEVVPLQVITMADPLAIEEGRRIARERNTLFQWSTRLGADTGVSMFPITRLARSVPEGILDSAAEENCDLILMSWSVVAVSPGTRMSRVLDPVVRRAPCDVAVVAYHDAAGEAERPISRILVPTAGGPHAPLAISIALSLAREYEATITAVYVTEPGASPEEMAEGRERIQQSIAAMQRQAAKLPGLNGQTRALEEIPIESRVITAESVVDGIAETGAEYDMVLIGASEESLIDQVLFGSLPEQVARACPTPVVMAKRYGGLPRFWLQRTWDALDAATPDLSREEQIEVYREVRRGARPDVDFFVMMGLSAIIATFGLLQNSAAVIIGAMLVAPLFTPILALSLAIVQGDVRLLRLAVESALKGIALAIGVAVLLTAASPLWTFTPEIAARIRPNLFDLAVALASGAAGAYAMARKDVATSLPGVAIAAALVPPLCTVGVGLAMGDIGIAGGSGLLFTTNLTAIALAGSVILLLLGFRPARRGEREARLRVGLVTTVVLLVLITIPLAAVFVQSVSTSRTRQAIGQALTYQLETMPDVELVSFEFEDRGGQVEVTATVYAQQPITEATARQLSDQLSRAIARPVRLRLATIPLTEIEPPPR
ncbi:MAG: amino acid permease [Anaerolineae bacterium]